MVDLLALTSDLIAMPSESFSEGPFVDWLEAELSKLDHLKVVRVGDNIIARTDLGRDQRWVPTPRDCVIVDVGEPNGETAGFGRRLTRGLGRSQNLVTCVSREHTATQHTEGPNRVLLGLDIQFGLGFMLHTPLLPIGGPRGFGHFGAGGSVGWADPDAELAFGYVMNKMNLGLTGDTRSSSLIEACYAAVS